MIEACYTHALRLGILAEKCALYALGLGPFLAPRWGANLIIGALHQGGAALRACPSLVSRHAFGVAAEGTSQSIVENFCRPADFLGGNHLWPGGGVIDKS